MSDWPLISIAPDEDAGNGVTFAIKHVIQVKDRVDGGCDVVLAHGCVISLPNIPRARVVGWMVEGLRGGR